MRLRSLRVQNFRAIDDLPLDFQDQLGRVRPITVIAGPNGCGKTSLLYGIVQALRGVMGYQTTDVPQPSDLDLRRSAGVGTLSPEPISVAVNFEVEFDDAERNAIPQVFAATRDSHPEHESLPDLPNGRIQGEWKYPPGTRADGTPRPSWHISWTNPRDALPWFRGYQYAVRGWKNRKLQSRTLLEQIGGLYLFPQDRGLKTRVLGEPDSHFDDKNAANSDTSSDEEQHQGLRGFQSVRGILKYLAEYARGARLRPEETGDPWEERVKRVFNRICHPKEYLGVMYEPNSPVGEPYFKDDGSPYPLHMASSGEQVVIEYIARLSYPSPMNHSLILIDEPELHLHPGWIRQLYRILPQIVDGNQYIMTTHSQELRRIAGEDGSLVTLGSLENVNV